MSKSELASRLANLQGVTNEDHNEVQDEVQTVLHELEVSQIELEVQNRELNESRSIIDEARERYLNLYDFAPVGYLTLDRFGVIKEINITAANLLGADRQKLLNRSLAQKIVNSDVATFRELFINSAEGEKRVSGLVHFRRSNQDNLPVQLISTCTRELGTGELVFRTVITDLSERVHSDNERQKLMDRIEMSRQELLEFVMKSPAPMAILSGPEHVFTLANTPYIEFVGRDVIGLPVRDVFSDSENRIFLPHLDSVFQTGKGYVGREVFFSKPLANGDVEDHFLNVNFTAFRDNEGKIKGVLVFGQDVTDQVHARKKLEAEKDRDRNMQKILKNEMVGAVRASETKSAFLANMSHEIRTPLGAILGFTDLIVNPKTSQEDRVEYSKIIRRNGKALSRIIDDILDLSKVEAGRLELEYIDFNIRVLVEEITELFLESAKKKNVSLNVEIDPHTPDVINCDPTRIRQILVNLVGNAVKFTSRGSILVRLEPVFNEARLSCIRFVIKDSGIGMTSEQAQKLFEPFSQADNTMTRKFGGTGLGLVLSRRLARALGGDVSILNCAPKKGCTFIATAKAQEVLTSTAVPTEYVTDSSINSELKLKILLVEDSPDNQIMIRRLLANAGMIVDIANNGVEGVEMAGLNNYDVVLMDMQMPVLDGYAATKQLRQDGYTKPIVALTAHAMLEERTRTLESGCNAHLTKPINLRLLIDTIARVQTANRQVH